MTATDEQLTLALTKALAFRMPQSAIFRCAGIDAERYLQGRLSQDIANLTRGSFTSSLLLSPQGRVQQVLKIVKLPDSFILIPENAFTKEAQDNFVSCLLQFKVADDVYLEHLPAFSYHLCIRGKESKDELSRIFPKGTACKYPLFCFSNQPPLLILPRPQTSLPGFDIFSAQEPPASSILGEAAGFELLRIYCGEPAFGKDITEKNIVSDLDLTNLVSFTKGCYAGQEVVEMSCARGHPNHRPVYLAANASQENILASSLAQVNSRSLTLQENIENLLLTTMPDSPETKCGTITSAAFFPNLGEIRAQGYVKYSISRDQPLYLNDKIFSQVDKPNFS